MMLPIKGKTILKIAKNSESRSALGELMSFLTSPERRTAYHSFLYMVTSAVSAESSSMWMYNAFEGGRINLVDSIGSRVNHFRTLQPDENIPGKVFSSNAPFFSSDCQIDGETRTRSSRICVPISGRGAVFGCVDLINKTGGQIFTEKDLDLAVSIASALAEIILSHSNELLLGYYMPNVEAGRKTLESDGGRAVVNALAAVVEARSIETGQHSNRIRFSSRLLLNAVSRSFPEYELNSKKIDLISDASTLHDIGKIAVPDAILNKPGKLTSEEYDLIKTHSESGAQIVQKLRGSIDEEYLMYAYDICRYHHERWDGGGYPAQLKEEEIPIWAQAVGLIDVFDALTNDRVYKTAYSYEEAVTMIRSGECGAFSPKLLNCFTDIEPEIRKLAAVIS